MILLDTGFLYALNDTNDTNHFRAVTFLRSLAEAELGLPWVVLPELAYLLHSRLSHRAMRNFLVGLAHSDIKLVPLEAGDMVRVNEILAHYAEARLDFTDAVIVAVAERLDIRQLLTFDRRDFAMIRPRHIPGFELLP